MEENEICFSSSWPEKMRELILAQDTICFYSTGSICISVQKCKWNCICRLICANSEKMGLQIFTLNRESRQRTDCSEKQIVIKDSLTQHRVELLHFRLLNSWTSEMQSVSNVTSFMSFACSNALVTDATNTVYNDMSAIRIQFDIVNVCSFLQLYIKGCSPTATGRLSAVLSTLKTDTTSQHLAVYIVDRSTKPISQTFSSDEMVCSLPYIFCENQKNNIGFHAETPLSFWIHLAHVIDASVCTIAIQNTECTLALLPSRVMWIRYHIDATSPSLASVIANVHCGTLEVSKHKS